MRGSDCSYGKDIELSFCEMGSEVSTVKTTLYK